MCVCLCVCACLSVCLSACLSVCLSVCLNHEYMSVDIFSCASLTPPASDGRATRASLAMFPLSFEVLPLQAHGAADAGLAYAGWGTPRPARRARIASQAGEQDMPSSVSPALQASSAASSPPVPVLPEPSADNTRRHLRWKQPWAPHEAPAEAAADPQEARVFVHCEWSSWPDIGDGSADGRQWLFRRRLTAWMAEVARNREDAPGVVLQAMENFKTMRRADKHELVSLPRRCAAA